MSAERAALLRRLAGIGVLLACALWYTPLGTRWPAVDALVPLAAAGGVWLLYRSTIVLAICVLALSLARARPGADDLMIGVLYPLLALLAGVLLVRAWRARERAEAAARDPDNRADDE